MTQKPKNVYFTLLTDGLFTIFMPFELGGTHIYRVPNLVSKLAAILAVQAVYAAFARGVYVRVFSTGILEIPVPVSQKIPVIRVFTRRRLRAQLFPKKNAENSVTGKIIPKLPPPLETVHRSWVKFWLVLVDAMHFPKVDKELPSGFSILRKKRPKSRGA
ncbi:MAG: hypothetical protein GY820_31965 [Gammaproteobacteria bacterium]|nr:hypothetical protein [Gammaproteobacteria bacterium]